MRIYDFILTLIGSFILVALMMNASIHSYIEQKYHLDVFDANEPILEILGKPKAWLDDLRELLLPSVEELALSQSLQDEREKSTKEKSVWERLMGTESLDSFFTPKEETRYPFIDKDGKLVLKQDSTFIFIGDSMMQGVGLTLASELKKRGFSVINIAKQSTGLTYTHFFDWGKALREAFAKNPHINIVVMMVGANDPYAMPKMKYGSDEWIETYSSRIKEIIDISLENDAVVVWYDAPYVRKEPLNTRLIFLNTLYKSQVDSAKQLLLHANSALAPDGVYTSYVKNEQGRSIRVRGEDGIHFSGEGSRALSRLLLERLEVVQEQISQDESTQSTTKTTPHTLDTQSTQKIQYTYDTDKPKSTPAKQKTQEIQESQEPKGEQAIDSTKNDLEQYSDEQSAEQNQNKDKKESKREQRKNKKAQQDKPQEEQKPQEIVVEKIKDTPQEAPKPQKRKWKNIFENNEKEPSDEPTKESKKPQKDSKKDSLESPKDSHIEKGVEKGAEKINDKANDKNPLESNNSTPKKKGA